MKKLLLLVFFACTVSSFSQNPNLTADAEISILTIGPGASLNDAFGHSAFRVKTGYVDLVYNYGVFDFNAPNFYLNFAKGKLDYYLAASYYSDFKASYIRQDRTIKEQVLNLSTEQKRQLYDFLIQNEKPENRYYAYDFFYDNCATKMYSVTEKVLSHDISYKTPSSYKKESFRKLMNSKVHWNSWGHFGINLALGSVIDKENPARAYMFLPEYIYEFFDIATFNSSGMPLVKSRNLIYSEKETKKGGSFFMSPLFIFSLLGGFILFITHKNIQSKTRSKWLDAMLFGTTGVVGLLLFSLWFATNHTATAYNYNLLWACPISLLALFQVFKDQPKKWYIGYLKLLVLMFCLMLLHWSIGVQSFAPSLIPLLIALVLRYIYLLRFYKAKAID